MVMNFVYTNLEITIIVWAIVLSYTALSLIYLKTLIRNERRIESLEYDIKELKKETQDPLN